LSETPSENTNSTTLTNESKPEPSYVEKRLAEAKSEPPRRAAVRWVPGQSGNPAGRPKGSRGKIALRKADLELSLREFSQQYVPHVLAQALEMALNGDRSMIKLILELHMSKPQHHDSEDAGKNQVQILVQNLTQDKPAVTVTAKAPAVSVTPQVQVLDTTYVEATSSGNDRNSEEYSKDDSSVDPPGAVDGEQ